MQGIPLEEQAQTFENAKDRRTGLHSPKRFNTVSSERTRRSSSSFHLWQFCGSRGPHSRASADATVELSMQEACLRSAPACRTAPRAWRNKAEQPALVGFLPQVAVEQRWVGTKEAPPPHPEASNMRPNRSREDQPSPHQPVKPPRLCGDAQGRG